MFSEHADTPSFHYSFKACLNSAAIYVDPVQDDIKIRIYAQMNFVGRIRSGTTSQCAFCFTEWIIKLMCLILE